MKAVVAVFAALVLMQRVQGYPLSAWYQCDRTRCVRPRCQCASETSPLPVYDTPQFIVISNDDQVRSMAKLVATANNTNGCPIPVTWFTRSQFSTCPAIRDRYQRGDEFASHAVRHIKLSWITRTADMYKEITGPRDYLYEKCGLPEGSVKGYRAPYRNSNPRVREMLAGEGFTYDSTTGFEFAEMYERPFPFTMNNGVPDPSCKTCAPTEAYSSIWEVPLWALSYEGQVYPMDPGMAKKKKSAKSLEYKGQVFPNEDLIEQDDGEGGRLTTRQRTIGYSAEAVLKNAFDQAYNNNRAPVPIAVHPYWFTETRLREAQSFVEYALTFQDVYFVTMSQLVEWMEDPVPVRNMAVWLKNRCQNKSLRSQN
ncbi:hypothetical protein Ndes2437A_g07022 [Nannochloris sp. 'desiccata']